MGILGQSLRKCEEDRLWALVLILKEMGNIILIINCDYYYFVSLALSLTFSSLFLPPTSQLLLPIVSLPIYLCLFTCVPLDPFLPFYNASSFRQYFTLLVAYETKEVTAPGMIQ